MAQGCRQHAAICVLCGDLRAFAFKIFGTLYQPVIGIMTPTAKGRLSDAPSSERSAPRASSPGHQSRLDQLTTGPNLDFPHFLKYPMFINGLGVAAQYAQPVDFLVYFSKMRKVELRRTLRNRNGGSSERRCRRAAAGISPVLSGTPGQAIRASCRAVSASETARVLASRLSAGGGRRSRGAGEAGRSGAARFVAAASAWRAIYSRNRAATAVSFAGARETSTPSRSIW